MTAEQYHLFARLFDAVLEVQRAPASLTGSGFCAPTVTLSGAIAGAALRSWAIGARVDVVPETCEVDGRSWTRLSVVSKFASIDLIAVHLNDDISIIEPAPVAVDSEIPF